jgi:hypothetical protein
LQPRILGTKFFPEGKSDRRAAPVFFGPCTLRRTWGTRPISFGLCYTRQVFTGARDRPSFAAPVKGPAVRKKLNSGTVVCCADAIPGMREEIVLGAVIELVTRTQLATDVETQSGNSDSN